MQSQAQTTSVADVLRQARAKIAEPERWTKGNYALDSNREYASPSSPDAVCWCPLGAIEAVVPGYWADNPSFKAAADALAKRVPMRRAIATYNDDPGTTHADILALFDRAIAAAEGATA